MAIGDLVPVLPEAAEGKLISPEPPLMKNYWDTLLWQTGEM